MSLRIFLVDKSVPTEGLCHFVLSCSSVYWSAVFQQRDLYNQHQSQFKVWIQVEHPNWSTPSPYIMRYSLKTLPRTMVESGLEFFIFKSYVPLQGYLLTCQVNSAILGRFFCTGQQQQQKKGHVGFQNKKTFHHHFKYGSPHFWDKDVLTKFISGCRMVWDLICGTLWFYK